MHLADYPLLSGNISDRVALEGFWFLSFLM